MKSSFSDLATARNKWWQPLVPFPRRKTLKRWFPGFEWKKTAHLISSAGTTVVIDVGANIGQYAEGLRAAGYRGRIVSFEPLPEAHAILTRKAAKDPGWTIAPRIAVGRAPGEITIHRYTDSSLSSALAPAPESAGAEGFANAVPVRTSVATLDALAEPHISDPDRVFVKIDVQGMEPEVIAGAESLLQRAVGVQIELALSKIYEGEKGYLDVLGLLDRFGLVPVYFLHVTSRRRLSPEAQMDAILLRSNRDAKKEISE